MTKLQKTGLILLIIGTLVLIKMILFPGGEQVVPPEEKTTPVQETPKVAENENQNQNVPKSYVNVYFIGQNSNKEEVYKVVKRPYDPQNDGTKLKYSIVSLLKGPNKKERAKGIYSEVPAGTKLISLEEKPDKIIVNLSGNFEQGGGTDGLYKRLYQLIKTSNKNTSADVYLYINGKQVDVVGGEGIMINQPLNDKSLDE